MNDPGSVNQRPESEQEEERSQGPSLTLIYSLLGLAMVVAMALAAWIVLPFYHRR